MKKWKAWVLNQIFTPEEIMIIINALYRRVADVSTDHIDGDLKVRQECAKMANSLLGMDNLNKKS